MKLTKLKNIIKEAIKEQTSSGNIWQYNVGACFDWAGIWTSNPVFSSTNVNQPCNHICSRITHWTNLSQNTNDIARQSRLKCKIQHGWDQYNLNSCSTVTSNFCPL